MHYDDTRATLRFLVDVLGFQQALAAADDEIDMDAVHERVRAVGGDVVTLPYETEFGSGARAYAFTARDPGAISGRSAPTAERDPQGAPVGSGGTPDRRSHRTTLAAGRERPCGRVWVRYSPA